MLVVTWRKRNFYTLIMGLEISYSHHVKQYGCSSKIKTELSSDLASIYPEEMKSVSRNNLSLTLPAALFIKVKELSTGRWRM